MRGLLAFRDDYQQSRSGRRRFTKSGLDLMLKRLAAHAPGPELAA